MTWYMSIEDRQRIRNEDGEEIDISLLGPIMISSSDIFGRLTIDTDPPAWAAPDAVIAQALQLRDAIMPNGRVVIGSLQITEERNYE